MAFIAYSSPKGNGAVYATIVESIRDGSKVEQKRLENLGRVVDKESGIFQNRKRGLFKYSIKGGYSDIESSAYIKHYSILSDGVEQEKLILDFGDSYILYEYTKGLAVFTAIEKALPDEQDTLLSLVFFRILTDRKAYCYAQTWWDGNYSCFLFPSAQLSSQRVSEFLVRLGDEKVQRAFFDRYLGALYGHTKEHEAAILIDSSGLPNASKMSVTRLNNHNGDISLEVRLIYVIDRRNGMPLYFRYCPGNIVDVSTLCATIAELSQYNVAVDYAIVDAGYFSEDNVKELYRNKIHFVTRLAPNRKIYKEATNSQLEDILSAKYAVRYGKRLVYMKKRKVDIYGYDGYAYIGVDNDSRNSQIKHTTFNSMDDKLSTDEIDKRIAKLGVFMILSSDDMDEKDILPLYYTRQQVEQVFDISKNNADILPLRIQNENTLRGHLMLTFMATAILQRLQRDIIAKRKKGDKINPEGAFMKLRNQKCKVYSKNVVPQEAVKEINAIYKLLKIDCPTTIARGSAM
jgi:hypothetical protein